MAAETILWPKQMPLVRARSELRTEISIESRIADIVTERFAVGVRLSESLDMDMIAVA
ncbi:MAG: hypothetical protein JNK19_10955 [Tabrizicola sp.]|nr:hypothetical protein [Tabrizicola sp.]